METNVTAKTIGILGGMGPYASSAFLLKILDATVIKNEKEHLHIVLDSNPHIPSRTRHVLYGENSPVPEMVESCLKLANYPVDAIAIPCNNASAWIRDVQCEIPVPVLNIIEITANKLNDYLDKGRKVAVWGGFVTYKMETYRDYLEKQGYVYVQHEEKYQRSIESFIERIKLNLISDELLSEINQLASLLKEELEMDIVVLGCTEFGCIDYKWYNFKFIDSLDVYARYVVNYAKSI